MYYKSVFIHTIGCYPAPVSIFGKCVTVVVSLILLCNLFNHQSSPILFYFIFSSIHWGRILYTEFKQHGLPLPIHCKGEPFKVSTQLFCPFCCAKCNLLFLSVLSYPQQPPLVLVGTCLRSFDIYLMTRSQGMQALLVDVI